MLSNLSKKSVIYFTKLGYFLKLVPWKFNWEDEREKYSIPKSLTSFPVLLNLPVLIVELLGFKIVSTLILANWIFAASRLVHSSVQGTLNDENMMFAIFMLLVYSLSTCLQLNHLFYRNEVADFFTAFYRYESIVTKSFQQRKVFDKSKYLILFIGTGAMLEIPALSILYLVNSNSPIYLGSLRFYFPATYNPLIKYGSFLFEILMSTLLVSNCLVHAFMFIGYMVSVSFWLKQMRPNINKRGKTHDKLRSIETVSILYRNFQVLAQMFNAGLASVAVAGQHFITSSLLIVCAFSTIRYFDPIHFQTIHGFISYMVFPMAFGTFFVWIAIIQPICAELVQNSYKLLDVWKIQILQDFQSYHRIQRRKHNIFLRSCRTINTDVGSFFYYRIITTPRLLNNVANHTVTLLISFP